MLINILSIKLNRLIEMLFSLNKKHNKFTFIMFNFLLLFVVPNYFFGDNFNADIKLRKRSLMYITHQDKTAKIMCFYDKYYMMNSVYFKGPSGILIKAGRYQNNDMNGYITYYEFVNMNGKKYRLRYAISYLHSKEGLDMPAMADINGTVITDYINSNDGGISEKKIGKNIIKEFQLLPSEFKTGLKEFYLFGYRSITDLRVITVYLGTIFRGISPYEVNIDRISNNEVETIQDFLSEINYCPSEKLLDMKSMTKAPDFIKYFKIIIGDKTITVLYKKKNVEEIFFRSSNGAKIMIYLTRNKFPGNLIKFLYIEKKKTYCIEQFIFSNFFENKQGIPIIYGFNGNYIAGISGNKEYDSLYKLKIENEIKDLPVYFQEGFREFWEYCIKILCKKEILNCMHKQVFGILLNKKQKNSKIEFINSKILKKKMIDEFKNVYGEKK